jgi:hypothetical protein
MHHAIHKMLNVSRRQYITQHKAILASQLFLSFLRGAILRSLCVLNAL